MDRLSSCYFCGGALDASLAEYPVVPRELQPAGDGPTVVLCSTCRRKLGAVVEEVVAATAVDDTPQSHTDVAATPDDGGSLLGDDTPTDERASPTGEPTADDEPADTDGASADSSEPGTDEVESPDPESDAASDAAAPSKPDREPPADEDEPRLTKLEYNKVMRLLQNRPFPVDRAEIREVAASAYDIEYAEFDAIVEAAIERDLIAERDGEFVDPG